MNVSRRSTAADANATRGMPMSTRITVLLVILGAAALGVFADSSTPASSAPVANEPTAVALGAPTNGSAYCVPLAEEEEGVRLTLLAVSAESHVQVLAGEEIVDERQVTPDEPAMVELGGDAAQRPVTVRWSGAAVVATYESIGEGPQVIQRCAPTTEPRWHLAGFNTTLGNNATLHLFNPFSADAVARVHYATPEGAVELVTTQDLAVPAGEAVEVDLDEVQPEIADLGVVVDVLTGRLVAGGEMAFAPPDEDTAAPTGRTALTGVAEPTDEHVFAYGAVGSEQQSWVSLMNPDPERDAIVLIGVSAPDPEAPVQEEITVPAGGTVRVDLVDRSERRTFATTVTVVNDVPIVATRFSTRDVDDEGAIDAAAAVSPSSEWLLLGGGTEGGVAVVDLFNPGAEPATVTVEPVGDGAAMPPEWEGLRLAANEQRGLVLSELDMSATSVPVRVRSQVPVAASIRSAAGEGAAAGFRSLAGFTSDYWSGLSTRPVVEFAPGLAGDVMPSASPSESASGSQ